MSAEKCAEFPVICVLAGSHKGLHRDTAGRGWAVTPPGAEFQSGRVHMHGDKSFPALGGVCQFCYDPDLDDQSREFAHLFMGML